MSEVKNVSKNIRTWQIDSIEISLYIDLIVKDLREDSHLKYDKTVQTRHSSKLAKKQETTDVTSPLCEVSILPPDLNEEHHVYDQMVLQS